MSDQNQRHQRHQCAKCPWKVSTNPNEIPGGYCERKHAALESTIADPERPHTVTTDLRAMACHETTKDDEKVCLGWLQHQLGPGNNIPLRLAVSQGLFREDAVHGKLVGGQHERFEDTLP